MYAITNVLTTTHMITWIKLNQWNWLLNYISTKKPNAACISLLKLLQCFCKRHGFTRQRPTKNKLKQTVLAEVQEEFASDFHHEYAPIRMIASDGTKLPLMFVIRGTPGGRIESTEVPTFPPGHYYAVQEKAWMDGRVWAQYLREVLGESIEEPSVVLLDNFECHVSDESYKIMYEELGAHLCPLPPNSTSVCQPLDVGVMAPFKRNLRNLWLLEEQIVGDDEDPFSPTACQKRMAMVKRAIAAWDMVSDDVIRRSCEKAIIPQLMADN
ncbi:hypothetical protein DYB34_008583 [Aphanomyces astaci]|uniref:DDE-1 domain-containing protein n=1 Tax=Aphanomyces astaci TaxID=112090 RepID=A0A418BMC8_APHAT|nr:hypothetical protein DYB34_008583 [Aphanomyces astaci]